MPGIAIEADQAEARFVTIRALNANYNYTQVDGVSVAVPDGNGRRVYMDVMPASLADKVNVYKTFTPNMEGSWVGGLVDIRTASAFDRPRNNLRLSAEIGQYENDKGFRGDAGPSGTANFTYSTTFGESDQFGVLFFANHYKQHSYIQQADSGSRRYFYDAAGKSVGQPTDEGTYPGTGLAVPEERRWFSYLNNRTRYGGGTKLEYRTDTDHVFLRGFWNTATDDEGRLRDMWNHAGGGTLTNQTADSGELRGATNRSLIHTLGWFDFERSVWGLTGGGEHEVDDRSDVSWRVNYSGSRYNNYENWLEWRTATTARPIFGTSATATATPSSRSIPTSSTIFPSTSPFASNMTPASCGSACTRHASIWAGTSAMAVSGSRLAAAPNGSNAPMTRNSSAMFPYPAPTPLIWRHPTQ